MRPSFSSFPWVVLIAWCGFIPPAQAQSTLERLERAIRERREPTTPNRPPSPKAAPNAPQSENGSRDVRDFQGLGAHLDDAKDRGRGVRITLVEPGSPADRAGLYNEDIITGIAGVRVRQLQDATDVLGALSLGQKVEVAFLRDGMAKKVQLIVEKSIAEDSKPSQSPETIPLPPAESLPHPPAPQATREKSPLQSVESAGPNATDLQRLCQRVEALERRVTELERELTEIRKKQQSPSPY